MSHKEQVRQIFEFIDTKDTAGFTSALSSDARFVFGNAPAVTGREAIRQAVDTFFGNIRSLSHKLTHLWEVPGWVLVQGEVTYVRHDGRTVMLPFADHLGMEGDLVRDWLVFVDISPLFAP